MRKLKFLSVLLIFLYTSVNLFGTETDKYFTTKNNEISINAKPNCSEKNTLLLKITQEKKAHPKIKKFHNIKSFFKKFDNKPKIEKYALKSFIYAVSGLLLAGAVILPLSFVYDFFLLGILIMGGILFTAGFISLKNSLTSLRNFKANKDKHRGKAFAIIGLVISIIELLSPLAAVGGIIYALLNISVNISFWGI